MTETTDDKLASRGCSEQVKGTLRETLTAAAQSGVTELDPKSLLVAGIVLLFLLYRKICSLA